MMHHDSPQNMSQLPSLLRGGGGGGGVKGWGCGGRARQRGFLAFERWVGEGGGGRGM